MGNCVSSDEKRHVGSSGAKFDPNPTVDHRFGGGDVHNDNPIHILTKPNLTQPNPPKSLGSISNVNGSNDPGLVKTPKNPLHQPHPSHQNHNPQIVIALYTYNSKDEGDLSFRKGDKLVIIDDTDPDWWLAKHMGNNLRGYIPRNYVASEAIETEEYVPPFLVVNL